MSIEEIDADLFLPKANQRGLSGVIIADDGTYLICGSLYPLTYYIEEFKSGKRDIVQY